MSEDVLYKKSYIGKFSQAIKEAPQFGPAFVTYDHAVFKAGSLDLKTKELIALAVAHVTGCPYCIEVHVERFKKMGGSYEELMEAVSVGAAVTAGGVIGHAINSYNAFKSQEAPVDPLR
ncbi:carboxymuconolactone decarboxylase family protein [Brevibacillus dissolubilis]|uniref:carboxymuconolactone decarboxylase family protein n=1 Tax=Brevibacillus dissolubilis TaxID=1844116 RepID=UPI001116D2AC|nr:carboxymuconolactone decarboxylase family protein [Brevibacillus dissolubilis]